METTNANKVALAVLGALLGTMALGVFSNAVFAPNKPAQPGYALAGGEAAPAPAAAAATAPEVALPALLATADAAKVGPPLWGIVGRPVASVAGFAYSDAVKALGGDWTYEKLNQWITKPAAMAAGTKMAFPGEPEATKRADILAYLQKQSDSPVAFPQ